MFNRNRFNKSFYLKSYPDVSFSGLDPYKHFLEYGKTEGRKPNKNAKLPIIDTNKICRKNRFIDMLITSLDAFSAIKKSLFL